MSSTITKNNLSSSELHKEELALLDLYSGCGGMSTGLCLGAKVSSVNLVTVPYMKFLFLSISINYIIYNLCQIYLVSLSRDGLLIVMGQHVKA